MRWLATVAMAAAAAVAPKPTPTPTPAPATSSPPPTPRDRISTVTRQQRLQPGQTWLLDYMLSEGGVFRVMFDSDGGPVRVIGYSHPKSDVELVDGLLKVKCEGHDQAPVRVTSNNSIERGDIETHGTQPALLGVSFTNDTPRPLTMHLVVTSNDKAMIARSGVATGTWHVTDGTATMK